MTIRTPVVSDDFREPITTPDISSDLVSKRIDNLLAILEAISSEQTNEVALDLLAGYTVLLNGIDQRSDGVRFGPGHALKVLDLAEKVFDAR